MRGHNWVPPAGRHERRCANGSRHVPVHRYRGVDPAVGSRRRRDAVGARGPRRAVAGCDRGARRLVVQAHRRRGVCGVRVAACRSRCRRRRAAGARTCRCGWASPPARQNCATSDYFGAVLNRAARVMAAGHGGQILLDGATAGLLGDFDLIGLGARRLRDIAKPVEMFQVRAPGLRSEFPPLKTRIRLRETCARPPPASWDERLNWPTWKRR